MDGGITRALLGVTVMTVGLMALVVTPFFLYEASQPHFALRKDQWGCTASHRETHYVMVGKVMTPQTTTVCDQWTRR